MSVCADHNQVFFGAPAPAPGDITAQLSLSWVSYRENWTARYFENANLGGQAG
jgi:hypothetical protein